MFIFHLLEVNKTFLFYTEEIEKLSPEKKPARRVLRQSFYSGKPEHDSRNFKRSTSFIEDLKPEEQHSHRLLRGLIKELK